MSRSQSLALILFTLTPVLLVACAHGRPVHTGNNDKATDALSLVEYRCDSGANITASYPTNDAAVVRYHGETQQMSIARSADGARYVGNDWVWWTKGAGAGASATLFKHDAGGGTGRIIERCEQTRGST